MNVIASPSLIVTLSPSTGSGQAPRRIWAQDRLREESQPAQDKLREESQVATALPRNDIAQDKLREAIP